ncbi:hypothetical protein K2X33_02575, partial [bacterium]|nr:hypothetical protein [bacterium]
LGVGRAVGSVFGARFKNAPDGAGSYWTSQVARGAVGLAGGELDLVALEQRLQDIGRMHDRYHAFETTP